MSEHITMATVSKIAILSFVLSSGLGSESFAGDLKSDNQQKLSKETTMLSLKTKKPVILLKAGIFTNISFSEETNKMASAEVCFDACPKSDTSAAGLTKGETIVHNAHHSEQMPTQALGLALDDLKIYETLECLYCVKGSLPIENVATETLPEERIIQIIASGSGFDKYSSIIKDFGFKLYPLDAGLASEHQEIAKYPQGIVVSDWKALVKTIYDPPGERTRVVVFFYKDSPVAIAMNLNPANVKRIEGAWVIKRNGFPRLRTFVRKDTPEKIGKQLDSLLRFVGREG